MKACTIIYTPIDVKPEATHGNLIYVYPQGGDFDHLTFQMQRAEGNKTKLLTTIFLPGRGGGIF